MELHDLTTGTGVTLASSTFNTGLEAINGFSGVLGCSGSSMLCPTSSHNPLQSFVLNTFAEVDIFLGFGATVGGLFCGNLGRGLGSGRCFDAPQASIVVSPKFPSCICSNAWIRALSVAMSSSSSTSCSCSVTSWFTSSSLSDWLALRCSGKPQSSELKASRSSCKYFPPVGS